MSLFTITPKNLKHIEINFKKLKEITEDQHANGEIMYMYWKAQYC